MLKDLTACVVLIIRSQPEDHKVLATSQAYISPPNLIAELEVENAKVGNIELFTAVEIDVHLHAALLTVLRTNIP